jgi:hypothetical protein
MHKLFQNFNQLYPVALCNLYKIIEVLILLSISFFIDLLYVAGQTRSCWVTTALTRKECLKALALKESLKRATTSASTAVLVDEDIPMNL